MAVELIRFSIHSTFFLFQWYLTATILVARYKSASSKPEKSWLLGQKSGAVQRPPFSCTLPFVQQFVRCFFFGFLCDKNPMQWVHRPPFSCCGVSFVQHSLGRWATAEAGAADKEVNFSFLFSTENPVFPLVSRPVLLWTLSHVTLSPKLLFMSNKQELGVLSFFSALTEVPFVRGCS